MLLHVTEAEISSQFGNYHFESGSGRYLPSYITSQGNVLVLDIESGIVVHITDYQLTEGKTDAYGDY